MVTAQEIPQGSPACSNLTPALTGAVTRQQHRDIPITIHYLDSVNQVLHPPVTVLGAFNEPLTIPWRTIPGYLLYDIRNFQRTFLLTQDGIDLIYTKQLAAPIMVFHEDETGTLLAEPQFIRGDLSRHYQLQPLTKYLNVFVGVSQAPQGTFSKNVQQIHFHYQVAQAHQQRFTIGADNAVKMRVAKAAYSRPASDARLDWHLPAGSTWQIFKTSKQTTTHAIWFNLGGDLWVNSLNTQLVTLTPHQLGHTAAEPPAMPAQAPLQLSSAFATVHREQLHRQAQINASPYFPISQWTQPYGQIASQRLANGTLVLVQQLITLENGSEWALLDQGYYVEIKYLNFQA